MPGSKDQINSSDLNRRIQIQAISGKTPDGFTDAWETIYSCWADIQNFPHGRGLFRRFLYSQLYPQMNTTIHIRFQQSVLIDATRRVLYPAHGINHIYQILGVENTLEANVSIWLLCQENQAQAAN